MSELLPDGIRLNPDEVARGPVLPGPKPPRRMVLELDLWAWADHDEMLAVGQLSEALRNRQVKATGASYDLRSYQVIRGQ